MAIGAGTPLIQSTLMSGAHSAADNLRNISLFTDQESNNVNTRSGKVDPYLTDVLTVSSEAQNHLDKQQNLLRRLEKGRGEITRQADQLLKDQLYQARDQIAFLHHILRQADPYTAKALRGSIESIGENLSRLSRHVADDVQTVDFSSTRISIEKITLKADFRAAAEISVENGERSRIEKETALNISFTKVDISHTDIKVVSDSSFSKTLHAIQNEFSSLEKLFFKKTST